jgi:uncharacterized protein
MTITIGKADDGKAVKLDIPRLIVSKMLITASSGGGKSYLLRKVLEQVSGHTQTIVIDVEGEFATLREKRDMVLAGPSGEVPAEVRSAGLLCRRLMELNLSAVIDISELTRSTKRDFISKFCTTMVELPRSLWRPCFVCIDETHEFAPEGEKSTSTDAVALLASKGRKRGYCLLSATQRLSKLDKDIAAECRNQLIGMMNLDIDRKRAADILGFGKERQTEIRDLSPPGRDGEFFGFGPAFSHRGVFKMRGDEVETTHPEAGQGRLAKPPEASTKIKSVLSELADLAKKADEEARTLADAQKQIRELQRQLKAAPKPEADPKALERAHAAGKAEAARESAAAVKERDRIIGLLKGRMGKAAAQFSAALPLLNVNGEAEPKVTAPVPAPQVQTRQKTVVAPRIPEKRSFDSSSDSEVGQGGLRRMLVALAQRPQGMSARQLGVRAGLSSSSGTFGTYLGKARQAGWIEGDRGRIAITDAGLSALGSYDPLPSGRDLAAYWLRELGDSGAARILESLVESYPAALSKDELAEKSGLSASSGTFGTYLSRLRTLELVEGRGTLKASDELFAE